MVPLGLGFILLYSFHFFQKFSVLLDNIIGMNLVIMIGQKGLGFVSHTDGVAFVEIVVEPVAIHDKAAMDKQLEEVEGQKAKAAYIHTRIVSELESRRYEDPMLFKRFSERIRETIAEYRRSRDENVYLASMKRMAEDLRHG